jgi:hypothetical protein
MARVRLRDEALGPDKSTVLFAIGVSIGLRHFLILPLCARIEILAASTMSMTEDKYPAQQTLANLKRILDSDPTDIEAANRYWVALASFGGHDVRSGGFVIEAFRGCALASHAGVVAFARAYRELFEKSGEKPRAELFDEKLLHAVKASLPDLSNDDRAIVQWLLASIE